MSKGVVYVASGEKYVDEAESSALSLKKHNPNLPITIFTDSDIDSDVFDQVLNLRDPIELPADSMLSEDHIIYDKNLFLDSDTRVCANIMDIFELLESSDIALAHAATRTRDSYRRNGFDIPDSFPEYNSGVIAYNNTDSIVELFEDWKRIYKEGFGNQLNQLSFRAALYESSLDIHTLPPEYNYRTHVVGFASGPVKILHGRMHKSSLEELENHINETTERRVITWDKWPCRVVNTNDKSIVYKTGYLYRILKTKIREEGMSETLASIFRNR